MTGLLSGAEIKKAGIIASADDNGYRASSYDIRIGQIITPDGKVTDTYKLPTQGIVEVVSAERIRLPLNLAGYALVKTGLCNEGLLALNIGILDPGYDGKLSSALINFGKSDRFLLAGEVFLRLTFHSLDGELPTEKPKPVDDKLYLADKQQKVVRYFSPYFLNVDEVARRSAEEVVGKWRGVLFFWVPTMALALGLLTFLLNFGALWSIQRTFQPADNVRTDTKTAELERDLEGARLDNRTLTVRLDGLEQLIRQIQSTPAVIPGPSAPIPRKQKQ